MACERNQTSRVKELDASGDPGGGGGGGGQGVRTPPLENHKLYGFL